MRGMTAGLVGKAITLAGVLVCAALVAPCLAQANFRWSSGSRFVGEVELAQACSGATAITIGWGDNTNPSPGALDFNLAVTGDHTYTSQGTFAGTVTFGDGPCAGRQDHFTATVGPPPKFTQCPAVRLDSGCALLINVTDAGASIAQDTTQPPYEDDEDALIGVQNDSSGPISSIPLSVPVTGHRNDLFGFDGDGLCNPGGPPVPSGCVAPAGAPPCGPEDQSCSFPQPAGQPAGYVEPGASAGSTQNGYEGPTSWFSKAAGDTSSGVVHFSPAILPGGTAYFSLELAPSRAITPGAAPVDLDFTSAPTVTASGASFTGLVNPDGLATNAYFQYGLDARYRKAGSTGAVYDHRTATQPVGGDFTAHLVTASVSGLVPNAIYHARLVASNRKGTTYGPDIQFKTAQLARPGAPQLAKTVNIAPVAGLVLLRLQGQVVPLTQLRQVPVGTEIDALQGTLKLITAKAASPGRATRQARPARRRRRTMQRGTFGGAIFRLNQASSGTTRGLVALTLVEGIFKDAPTFAACKAGGESKSLETLSANARGAWVTRGHFGSVAASRARWTVTDRCDGTLTRVMGGSVLITDLARPRVIVLSSGQSYLARPRARGAGAHRN